MARIPYRETSEMSEPVKAALGKTPANVSRMLAGASESVFTAFSAFGNAMINASSLPPTLRELAILRVGYLSKAEYETFQHEALGRFVGLTDEKIEAIKSGDTSSGELDDVEAAVIRFVDDIVSNVRASDRTLEGVREHLNDTQLIDLILVTGNYMMISRFLETTGVDLDPEPIDWNAFTEN